MIERAPRVIVLPGRKATLIDTYRESTADIFRNLTNTSFHDIYFKWPLTPLPKTLAASTTTAWDDQLNGQRCVTATSGCFEQQEIPVNSSDYKNLILQCTKALENDADLISAFIIDPMNCKTVIQLHASDPSLSMFSRHPAYQAIGKLADYHRDIRLPTFHRIVRQCDEPETLDSAETVDLLYSKAYLATGLDVILRDEPCCFCYMALLHSRVRRVYYLNVKTAHPCTATRQLFLHERKSLNHQFLVFQKNRRIP